MTERQKFSDCYSVLEGGPSAPPVVEVLGQPGPNPVAGGPVTMAKISEVGQQMGRVTEQRPMLILAAMGGVAIFALGILFVVAVSFLGPLITSELESPPPPSTTEPVELPTEGLAADIMVDTDSAPETERPRRKWRRVDRRPGMIKVRGPKGAVVRVDGRVVGKIPLDHEVKAGGHSVSVVLPGGTKRESIIVDSGTSYYLKY